MKDFCENDEMDEDEFGGEGAKFCEKTGFREGVRIINMSTIISEYLIAGAVPPPHGL